MNPRRLPYLVLTNRPPGLLGDPEEVDGAGFATGTALAKLRIPPGQHWSVTHAMMKSSNNLTQAIATASKSIRLVPM